MPENQSNIFYMLKFFLVIFLIMLLLWSCYFLLIGEINFITKIKTSI